MAKVTCKKFTFAPYVSGGDGAPIVYGTGTMLEDYLAKVDISEERTDEKEYADGHLIDSEKIPTAVSMAMELVNNNAAIKKGVLGMVDGTNGELLMTENDAPFIGAGCLMANRFKGVITWEGYWIYKIQFTPDTVSAETRRDRTNWQHQTINGTGVGVQLGASDPTCYYAHKEGMTEAEATAWLQAHGSVSA